VLSFLFKYPISKLTFVESAQIEILINTLTMQKPLIKASDMFTMGTRLLASVKIYYKTRVLSIYGFLQISGTVLTYVLVALQFHVLWSKEE
jgi:hypothetical protein